MGALLSLNSVGVTSLTYALQRKENAIEYYKIVAQQELFHGGLEFVHQVYTTLVGGIYFENHPLIYRDFTYIGYIPDVAREAPDDDDFPYLGKTAVTLAASMISERSNLTADEAFVSLVNHESTYQLQESRQAVSSMLETLPIPFIEPTTHRAAKAAWFANLEKCYPGEHLNLRRLIGSFPHSIRKRVYSLRSYLAKR